MTESRVPYELDVDGPAVNPFGNRYQILALSGGGYRGLFTAALLVKLEEEAGPLNKRFDLITGTSIGSILAGALTVGVSAVDCLQGMRANGEKIFPPKMSLARIGRLFKQFTISAPYKTDSLVEAIDGILKDSANTPLSSIDRPLSIPCVSYTRAAPLILRSKGLSGTHASDTTLRDAMLASSAAPTYFPSRKIVTEVVVDGGLVANAPELVGITDAIEYGRTQLSDIHVLSIGTAFPSITTAAADPSSSGVLGWMVARGLFQTTMKAQELMAQGHCQSLIGDRYIRLDAQPSKEQSSVLKLDRADGIASETLVDLARECWEASQSSGNSVLASMLQHTART